MGHTLQFYQSGLDVLNASLRSGSNGAEDIVAPVVTVTGGPGNPTTSTSATFAFTADETATFACSIDGGAAACDTGTVTYTGLSVGSHTFSVTATDLAGNVSVPVTSTWTIARLGASVSVSDDAFTQANIQVAQRRAVTWTFNGTKDQSVTESSGSGLFDSGTMTPGTTYTFVFTAAGRYDYNSSLTPSMRGSVKVPIIVSATRGEVTDTFTVRWASAVAPAGFEYDVQVKRPGSSVWANWKVNQTGTTASFVPDGGTGVYSFRARMQNTSNTKASGWSPLKTITIS
jgi:plastocyanin